MSAGPLQHLRPSGIIDSTVPWSRRLPRWLWQQDPAALEQDPIDNPAWPAAQRFAIEPAHRLSAVAGGPHQRHRHVRATPGRAGQRWAQYARGPQPARTSIPAEITSIPPASLCLCSWLKNNELSGALPDVSGLSAKLNYL